MNDFEKLTPTATLEKLALFGGSPLAPALAPEPWPPTSDEAERALIKVFRSRKWSFNGPREQAFCAEFAAYHGARHAVFMANGTVTLQCALQRLNGDPGMRRSPDLYWIPSGDALESPAPFETTSMPRIAFFLVPEDEAACIDLLRAIRPNIQLTLFGSGARGHLQVVDDISTSPEKYLWLSDREICDQFGFSAIQIERCTEFDDMLRSGRFAWGPDPERPGNIAMEGFFKDVRKVMRKIAPNRAVHVNPVTKEVLTEHSNPGYSVGDRTVEWLKGDSCRILQDCSVKHYFYYPRTLLESSAAIIE